VERGFYVGRAVFLTKRMSVPITEDKKHRRDIQAGEEGKVKAGNCLSAHVSPHSHGLNIIVALIILALEDVYMFSVGDVVGGVVRVVVIVGVVGVVDVVGVAVGDVLVLVTGIVVVGGVVVGVGVGVGVVVVVSPGLP
jgi:hypothetical protein